MNNFSWPEKPSLTAFPIARPGYALILVAALITVLLVFIGFSTLLFVALLITLFISFGARLDIYLPVDSELSVKVGEKVQAGTSILGYLKNG